jgi:hypothetical protein
VTGQHGVVVGRADDAAEHVGPVERLDDAKDRTDGQRDERDAKGETRDACRVGEPVDERESFRPLCLSGLIRLWPLRVVCVCHVRFHLPFRCR